jgi:hypothetical protein
MGGFQYERLVAASLFSRTRAIGAGAKLRGALPPNPRDI